MACEAGKGNEKREKREIRLLVSPTPRKKKKQVITEVKGNAPRLRHDGRTPPCLALSYFCGNSGCDFPMRDLRHRRCIEGVFCPHAPLRVSSKCERSRAGKSQPELPFRNTVDRLHFRFTKPKKCGTLERDIQRNYKEEWSVTNWAF